MLPIIDSVTTKNKMATYSTNDLYLASAIKTSLRLPFPEIHVEGRLSSFIFRVDPNQAQQIATRFYNDELTVLARRYAQDLRDLKSLIFRAKEGMAR